MNNFRVLVTKDSKFHTLCKSTDFSDFLNYIVTMVTTIFSVGNKYLI